MTHPLRCIAQLLSRMKRPLRMREQPLHTGMRPLQPLKLPLRNSDRYIRTHALPPLQQEQPLTETTQALRSDARQLRGCNGLMI